MRVNSMVKEYGIRIKWKNGRNEIREFGTSSFRRNLALRKLKKNPDIEEAVPFTSE